MTIWVDGDIAHLEAKGTELERFSIKEQRYVLLAYHDDNDHAFVYPLSTTAPKSGTVWSLSFSAKKTYVILQHGLFQVPFNRLKSMDQRAELKSQHRRWIQQHLKEREIRPADPNRATISQRPFKTLEGLVPKPESKPTQNTKQMMPPKSDKELFEEYLQHDLPHDIHRAKEGRGKD